MIYVIEYSYDDQIAISSFHFMESDDENMIMDKINDCIEKLLECRFKQKINFSIKKVEKLY